MTHLIKILKIEPGKKQDHVSECRALIDHIMRALILLIIK